ncbi:hypothetical protein EMWEY_00056210 [Eimeria maxima]|uniref:Uncharacterized protein n=1 Tax=Eimeria maxima TaxID=5804 RepID=U6MC15_EIMMA|nr:hypothetical protein EMWEY_00056210 [Eimeria maxima]CDJ59210.1 hypothetical protein EMWEY_00056210 [Eimeria maxima]
MEVQGKDAGRIWLDLLRPEQGARKEIHPAGLQNAENINQTAEEDGIFASRKFVGKQVGGPKPLLAVFSLVLLSAVVLRVSSKRKIHQLSASRLSFHNEWASRSLDDHAIRRYLNNFDKAADVMNKAWKFSLPPVREAFQRHFMPSLSDGQAPTEDPLATINDHVAKMRGCEFPFDSSAQVRSDFLQHLQLLLSICEMVTLRIEELNWLFSMRRRLDARLSFPVNEEPDRNSTVEGVSYRTWPQMKAEDFLRAMGMDGGELTPPVDGNVAKQLLVQSLTENKYNVCNLEARYYFERFLQHSGEDDAVKSTSPTAKYHIPYDGKPFRTGALAQAAAQIFRESEGSTNYAMIRKLHWIGDNWTPKAVLEAGKQQEKENAYKLEQLLRIKREQMRVLLKKGIQYGDLEMNALFLL